MNVFFYIIIFIIGLIIGIFYKYIIHKDIKWLKIVTGILFVLFALALKLNINNLNIENVIAFIFIMAYLVCIILVAATDKKARGMQKIVLSYGIVLSVIYIIYICLVDKVCVCEYLTYLLMIIILLLLDNLNLKKKAENSYTINMLMLILIMLIFTGKFIWILTILSTIITILIYKLIKKIYNMKKNNKKDLENIKIGFILTVTNITIFLISLAYMSLQK